MTQAQQQDTTQLIAIIAFGSHFPDWFREHARRLFQDANYSETFQAYARFLEYERWLETDCWKLTARLLVLFHPFCAQCGATRRLHVHHLTYLHVGAEVLYLGDLEVLCETCHGARHAATIPPALPNAPAAQLRLQLRPDATHVPYLVETPPAA